jgi:hypothetical protein
MTRRYRSRPTRRRRTAEEMGTLREAICRIVEQDAPVTVRQVFYRLVTEGLIRKSESEYKQVVVRLLGELRLDGTIPFSCIADNTRWVRRPPTWSGIDQILASAAESYRRSLWDSQDSYVELWLEKEALAGVLVEVTGWWQVPLMVTRGYPSLSYLHVAAEVISAEERPAFIYYFGDHDPSGLDISRTTEARLREFAPGAEIHFERVAVTREQIEAWDLPSRPTKKRDTRSRGFRGESTELDAIAPSELRRLADDCISWHVDQEELARLKETEQEERETLQVIASGWSRPS